VVSGSEVIVTSSIEEPDILSHMIVSCLSVTGGAAGLLTVA